MRFKSVLSFLGSLLLVYFAVIFALYMTQRSFIYFPTTFDAYNETALRDYGTTVISSDGLEWLNMRSKQVSNKYLVYFHGNGGAAIDRLPKMMPWAENGYNVVFAEYPGYGTNTGQNSEQAFFEAGRTVMNKTLSDFPQAKLYLYGESIGSGTAIQMATEYDVEALIIENGFSSLGDLVRVHKPFVPTALLKDKFDNIAKINETDTFLLSVHGTNDRIVPFKYGEKLYQVYDGPKEMVIIEGAGHNDLYMHADMNDIIQRLNEWNGRKN